MNTLKQLLRQPVRFIAALIVLSMACSFLCLGFATFFSAKETAKHLEESFATIAIPTSRMEQRFLGDRPIYMSIIDPPMWEYITTLPENEPVVLGDSVQQYISAWCPDAMSVVRAQDKDAFYAWGAETRQLDDYGVFVVEITTTEEVPNFDGSPSDTIIATGTILETISLHPGFESRSKIEIIFCFLTPEEMLAENIQVGGKYLVYGSYLDLDLQSRSKIADTVKCKVSEVDWDKFTYDIDPNTFPEGAEIPYAEYKNGDNGIAVGKGFFDARDCCELYVSNRGGEYRELSPNATGAHFDYTYEDPLAALLSERLDFPTVVELTSDVDTFLSSDEAEPWRAIIDQCNTQHHCFPVIGTDLLQSLYLFQQYDTVVTQGRMFSSQEYQSGAKVCMISETVALESGLSVGDRIDASFYWSVTPQSELSLHTSDTSGNYDHNMPAQTYNYRRGFEGKSLEYEIVGIYRQSNLWENSSHAFTPNTIFVPNKSLSGFKTYSGQTGIFYTLLLKNGGIDRVKALIAEQGYPADTLLYYDGGYSEFAPTVDSFNKSALQLFCAAAAAWVAILAIYIVLFVRLQRKNMGLMLSLGSGKVGATRFTFNISIIPVLIATAIGAIFGAVLTNGVLRNMLDSAKEVLGVEFSSIAQGGHAAAAFESSVTALPLASLLMAVIQLALFAAVILIYASSLAKRKPLNLLRDK